MEPGGSAEPESDRADDRRGFDTTIREVTRAGARYGAVLIIDGVHFAGHVALAGVGVDSSGEKHVLGLWEGAAENAACFKALIADMVERGLRTGRTILVVMDGSKALRKAVSDCFGDRAIVQRCREHKKRNVLDALRDLDQALERAGRSVDTKKEAAYR